MSADAPAQTAVKLTVRRELQAPGEPPIVAHHVVWTRIGDEIVLEFGFFDFPEAVKTFDKLKTGALKGDNELVLHITHRFGMALPKFVEVMEEALAKIKETDRSEK